MILLQCKSPLRQALFKKIVPEAQFYGKLQHFEAKKAHFVKIEIKVFGAIFEKKNYAIMYVYRGINDGFQKILHCVI